MHGEFNDSLKALFERITEIILGKVKSKTKKIKKKKKMKRWKEKKI